MANRHNHHFHHHDAQAKLFLAPVDYTCISDNYWLGTRKPCVTYVSVHEYQYRVGFVVAWFTRTSNVRLCCVDGRVASRIALPDSHATHDYSGCGPRRPSPLSRPTPPLIHSISTTTATCCLFRACAASATSSWRWSAPSRICTRACTAAQWQRACRWVLYSRLPCCLFCRSCRRSLEGGVHQPAIHSSTIRSRSFDRRHSSSSSPHRTDHTSHGADLVYHSSVHSHTYHPPTPQDLVKLLATLNDNDGKVAIEGIYDR